MIQKNSRRIKRQFRTYGRFRQLLPHKTFGKTVNNQEVTGKVPQKN